MCFRQRVVAFFIEAGVFLAGVIQVGVFKAFLQLARS